MEESITKPKKFEKIKVIACKECGISNTTLIKAIDSYYCKFCFNKLGKEKYKKKGKN